MTSETSTEICSASPQGAGRQLERPARGHRTWIAAVIMILALLGLVNALTMIGDDKSAAPLHEIAKNFELINSLVQRAAIPNERKNAKLLRDLGAACAAAGRDPEARCWYRLAIARDPLDVESQQALFQIENRDRSRDATPNGDSEPRK